MVYAEPGQRKLAQRTRWNTATCTVFHSVAQAAIPFALPFWKYLWVGQPKVNEVKTFCLFQSLWNVHKSNFRLIPWATPKLLDQKSPISLLSQNVSLGQTFLAAQFFLFIDILLKVQQQILIYFASLFANSVIILGCCAFLYHNYVLPTTVRLNVM